MKVLGIGIAFLGTVVLSTCACAGYYSSSNGIYGSGSFVGSNTWFADVTQIALDRAASRQYKGHSSTGTKKETAKGRKNLGYFMIDPAAVKHYNISTTSGWTPPKTGTPWIKPTSDKSWRPPVIGPGYVAPSVGPGFIPPTSDGNFKPPVVGPGFVPPTTDGNFKAPVAGPGFVPPTTDGSFKPPVAGPGFVPPTTGSTFKSPVAGPGFTAPSQAAFARGNDAVKHRDLDAAVNEYKKAVTLSGGRDVDARFNLGIALLGQHHADEAIKQLTAVVDARPKDNGAQLMCAISYLAAGDLHNAELHASASSASATQGMSDLVLGMALDGQGKRSQAIAAYQNYLKYNDLKEIRDRVQQLITH